jgi:1-acyl-sn-glycerol-3-phosphate acyltransferase
MTYVNPFWEIEVDGAFPENPRNPYVCVSNHLSQGDPPIIARVPWEMKWVAKAELFRLPFAGWLLRMSGDIPVDRRDRDSRANTLVQARDYLQKKCSVMFFPEGTRSRDGRVHRFADGAFRLAIREGVPVLPIAIDGTRAALPKHSIWFEPNPETIRVRVLPPVDTSGYDADASRELQREVRARIIAQLAEWRGVPPSEVDALTDSDADATDPLPAEAVPDTASRNESDRADSSRDRSARDGSPDDSVRDGSVQDEGPASGSASGDGEASVNPSAPS